MTALLLLATVITATGPGWITGPARVCETLTDHGFVRCFDLPAGASYRLEAVPRPLEDAPRAPEPAPCPPSGEPR